MARIDLESVFKAYGDHTAVIRDVNLNIADGEFCVFVGPSGCGKSTLLRMVAGLEEITSGTLAIGGRRMNEVPSAQRGVAMVFQSYALFPHMTVAENMGFGMMLAKTDKAEIDRRVGDAARVLQLTHLLDRKPKALSGGQRQRVAIGRAIVRSPGVFLFDEPLSNLDAALRAQTRYEIARLHRSFGNASTVYVTHDQVEAMTLADRILLLNSGPAVAKDGSVAQCGSPLELYHHPCNLFVAGFIGSPRMNTLPATVTQALPDRVQVTLGSGETLSAHVDGSRVAAGAKVTVGVRPEHIELGNATQHIVREVQWQERLGDSTFLYVKTDNALEPIVARAPGESRAESGQRIALSLPADALHMFDDQGLSLPRLAATTDMVLPKAA
jgi:multiple sugar transport system ATP-binding protein